MKREVEYKFAEDDRNVEATDNQTFVAYIKEFTLQYERVFFRKYLYFYLMDLWKSNTVSFLSHL